ncbi:MAG: hypothetical protein ACREUF_18085, partial [Solimonas sp.]
MRPSRSLSWVGWLGVVILAVFLALSVAGLAITPYPPAQILTLDGDKIAQLEPPSARFLLGTTYYGRDVLSQLIAGTRVAFIVGVASAIFITFI